MPILKPEIQKALRAAGLGRPDTEIPLSDRLEIAGLGLDNILESLSSLANNSSNEAIKRQAVETALKLHGVLKEQSTPPQAITIVINDPTAAAGAINPILIPREVPRGVPSQTEKELVN